MFKKILIANRGAIACRIIRTLKKMDIIAVVVYAEADRESLHVEQADEAYSLGDGRAATTYLDQNKILDIALKSKVDAIHPGYGFLSENPSFVSRCQKTGIVFIGPSSKSMGAFSLKHKARELAEKCKVPLIPGSNLLEDKQQALAHAEDIGYPVMLKSSAGGGGIGMQVCASSEQLDAVFDSVVRMGKNNFSDGRVFLEKYIQHARHIEVQAFGDGSGLVIPLGERDCSLQRRNQKVIEEAPAPFLDQKTRSAMHETACRLLANINYANAGTVEFIYDSEDRCFYFLEVNTRLQVEHGVTEEVYGIDLVAWMIEQAYTPIGDLAERKAKLIPHGHAIQARIYAENPAKQFQPSAGLLSHVTWSQELPVDGSSEESRLRIDTWIRSGVEVAPFFDPMLAKVIAWSKDRNTACAILKRQLETSEIYGFETNIDYAAKLLNDPVFISGNMHTRYLDSVSTISSTIEVLSAGTMTTIQDYPARLGYWEVGVPPSGPFDNRSFQLGNALLGNDTSCAGLEITMNGPALKFYEGTQLVITGAEIDIELEGITHSNWQIISVAAGQVLRLGKIKDAGARAYLLIKDGFSCPDYLGSKSTFTLGQFGGHAGRALKTGDVVKFQSSNRRLSTKFLAVKKRPQISHSWQIKVVYGPHGAPDFFTKDDIATFFASQWQVHYNSSRTGIRLVGPKPQWARESGGEAGMHPSNIHDNAYAFGSIDFTGDMPVILGPDGPSLGGFVCPATVINADLWKLGQLRAGDTITFIPISIAEANHLSEQSGAVDKLPAKRKNIDALLANGCILTRLRLKDFDVVIRPAGDRFILIEFGEQKLDLRLRFHVYALREKLSLSTCEGIIDLTPGIRSLQVHYDPRRLTLEKLLSKIEHNLEQLQSVEDLEVPSRVVHLPLSWDDKACHEAIEKYDQSVRKDAPWCPSNIEFIRRINGLPSIDDVRNIVFNARYVVMGLGDVYLGAPVATPLDPRHRLVTTKYNPARTWTAENSVGIGGAYLCVYGMEGPGGYQFVGRTIQMWNRYRITEEFKKPWLLRFFDQIKFYPVSHNELMNFRRDFPSGKRQLKIKPETFSLKEYEQFLADNTQAINAFQTKREKAFQTELAHWRENGQLHFDSSQEFTKEDFDIPSNLRGIESPIAGSIWKILVSEGETIQQGQTVLILESMKMEIEVQSTLDGVIERVLNKAGATVSSGQMLFHIKERI